MEVNIHEAKTHLSRLLARVAMGEEVIIAKAGTPVAKLAPIKPAARGFEFDRPRAILSLPMTSIILFRKKSKIFSGNESPTGYAHFSLGDHRREKTVSESTSLVASSELWWSVVSLWEAIQKAKRGKLSLPLPAGPFLTGELSSNHVGSLPVNLSHVCESNRSGGPSRPLRPSAHCAEHRREMANRHRRSLVLARSRRCDLVAQQKMFSWGRSACEASPKSDPVTITV